MNTVSFTDEAGETLNNMARKIAEISAYYGKNSDESLNAIHTFAYCLSSIVGMGGNVFSDGEIDLGGRSESGLSYGMVWHSKPAPADRPGFPDHGTWSIHS
jgi:hypothetical protein